VVSITTTQYDQIITEIESISLNIYDYCSKIFSSNELEMKCTNYVTLIVHTNMPISFEILNIDETDSRINTLVSNLVKNYINNIKSYVITSIFKETILNFFINTYGFPRSRPNDETLLNNELDRCVDEIENHCFMLNNINLSKYLEIISEVQTVSDKIINSCDNKRNLNDNQLRSYCMGYIMSNIHSMPISYTILNINHSDEKIVKLGNDLFNLYFSNSYLKFDNRILEFLYSYGLTKLLILKENEKIPDTNSKLKEKILTDLENENENNSYYNSIKSCIKSKLNPLFTRFEKQLIVTKFNEKFRNNKTAQTRGYSDDTGFDWLENLINNLIDLWPW
jgi:hypothetical protein